MVASEATAVASEATAVASRWRRSRVARHPPLVADSMSLHRARCGYSHLAVARLRRCCTRGLCCVRRILTAMLEELVRRHERPPRSSLAFFAAATSARRPWPQPFANAALRLSHIMREAQRASLRLWQTRSATLVDKAFAQIGEVEGCHRECRLGQHKKAASQQPRAAHATVANE